MLPKDEFEKKRMEREMKKQRHLRDYVEEIITIPVRCENCKHYELEDKTCHRYAPHPIVVDCSEKEPTEYWGIFPQHTLVDWCSEIELSQRVLKNAPRTLVDGIMYIGGLPKEKE